ncbi:restriction endonuclease subunit S [Haloimpatiens sp. FM7330]|uniref:restriction endonuclease subunit S n=1 Tax=Haloimpatiens sp. FM7330 TaxID=3298610 RepID=UPI003639B02D
MKEGIKAIESSKEGYKKTKLGVIPQEWEIVRLEDICDRSDKYSFTGGPFGSDLKSCHYTEDGVQIVQLQNIGEGHFINDSIVYTSEKKADELKTCNIYPNDIIIAKMAEPVARACKIPNYRSRYLMCSDGIRVVVDRKKYNNDFILYSINSEYFRNNAIANSTGSTRLRIGLSALRNLKLISPPLDEQRKIAEILSIVDDQIDNTDKLIEKTKELKKGLMQRLLTKGIGHKEFKKTKIGEIPMEWEVDKFKNITDILRCGVASTPTYVDEGVPFLSAQNIQDGKLSLHKYNLVSREYHEKLTKKDKPQYGDILYSRVGANYGIAAVVNSDFEFSVYVSLTLIRMKQGYDSEFYKYLLNSAVCRKQADIGVFQGAGVPNLNVKIVEKFNMIVPPLEEQQQIATILSSVDTQIEEYENEKAKLEELKKGLMQQLLTGKIRTV